MDATEKDRLPCMLEPVVRCTVGEESPDD